MSFRSHSLPALLAGAALLLGPSADAQTVVGQVSGFQKISETEGFFGGTLGESERFGWSLAPIGDVDCNGNIDLAVGAFRNDDGGFDRGSIWILRLDDDAKVIVPVKISDTSGGFLGTLDDSDWFGWAVAGLGDLDGDGIGDVAVGAPASDDNGSEAGAVWILFLNSNGSVKSHQKISNTDGNLGSILPGFSYFGASIAVLGDLDGDSVVDLAVGAYGDDENGFFRGALYVLFLNTDGTVKGSQKINETSGGFIGALEDGDEFGWSAASLGDLDGDGFLNVAVGAPLAIGNEGTVWMLELDTDGTVDHHSIINKLEGGFTGDLQAQDQFGRGLGNIGDLDGDGITDLAVGAHQDDGGGYRRGAVYLLFLNADGTVREHTKIGDSQGGFSGDLDDEDQFGNAIASLGDINDDGVGDIAVGAPRDDDGDLDAGAFWNLFLSEGGWPSLGNALAGSTGLPQLVGSGTAMDGDPYEIKLSNALPFAPADIIIGLNQVNAPFKGGIFVPSFDFTVPTLPVGADGTITIPGLWPPLIPIGITFYMQAWIQDPGGVSNFAASNGLSVTSA